MVVGRMRRRVLNLFLEDWSVDWLSKMRNHVLGSWESASVKNGVIAGGVVRVLSSSAPPRKRKFISIIPCGCAEQK